MERKKTSDEFYSTREFVEYCMSQIKPGTFKDKIVYMPADSDESEFVKYFKEFKNDIGYKELIYTSDDFFTHKDIFDKCDIVFTNPPFSKQSKQTEFFKTCNCEFILMNTLLGCSMNIEDMLNFFKYNTRETHIHEWKNIDKRVNIMLYSTINCFIDNPLISNRKPKLVDGVWKGGSNFDDLVGQEVWITAVQFLNRQRKNMEVVDIKDNKLLVKILPKE